MEKSSSSSLVNTIESLSPQSSTGLANFDINKLLQLNNPVFSGGFGLAILAAGAQLLRFGSSAALNIARKNLLVTLEVTSKDRSYPWVLHWLTSRGSRTQHLSVETTLKSTLSGGTSTLFGFVPGPGFHLIWYKNHLLGVQRLREQQMVDLNTGKPWEKVQFMGIGRNTQIFESILQEAYDMATRQEEGKTIIFTNWGTEWRPFGQPRARRSLESVILDEGVGEKIFNDVCEWRSSSDWYLDRGIPYRRGYLLYGPPGSGKTSFIMALAGKMGYNICVLNLAERGLTDDRLAVALSSVPPQCIVLLEDVDVAFPDRALDTGGLMAGKGLSGPMASYGGSGSEVTFSGLLNILDGAVSSEERLIFMTTNYVDRLDSALIRPGRVDMAQFIADATPYQVRKMFSKFYPTATPDLTEAFVQQVEDIGGISMAQLQGYFLLYKDDPKGAYQHIDKVRVDEVRKQDRRRGDGGSCSAKIPSKGGSSERNCTGDDNPVQVVSTSRRVGPRRALTAHELDKMPFNPQYDWESGIHDPK